MSEQAGQRRNWQAATAIKHPIFTQLEDTISNRWTDFQGMVSLYDANATTQQLLDYCVRVRIITQQQRALIDQHWSQHVRYFCGRFKEVFSHIKGNHLPRLNAWFVPGGTRGRPRVLIEADGESVDVVILAGNVDEGIVAKAVAGLDPEFLHALQEHHHELGGLFDRMRSGI